MTQVKEAEQAIVTGKVIIPSQYAEPQKQAKEGEGQ